MATYNLFLKEPKADKETPILLKIAEGKKMIRVYTGESVHPRHWDKAKQRIRSVKTLPTHPERNEFLKSLLEGTEAAVLAYKTKGVWPTGEQIKMALAPKVADEKDFFTSFERFIANQSDTRAEGTVKNFKTLRDDLRAFAEKRRLQLTFESIDLGFCEDYRIHLLKKKTGIVTRRKKAADQEEGSQFEIKQTGRNEGLLNDTVSKYISNLKTFMKWALERKLHANTEFTRFEVKARPKNEIVTLTEAELLSLFTLDLSEAMRLERARDLFCFGAFTGQRWSDISNVSKEQIRSGAWDFISTKTKKRIIVPLKGFAASALTILEKYDYQFPIISAQKFNDYIKDAAKLAKIDSEVVIKRYSGREEVEFRAPKWQYVSSHMARRTFVTILLQRGVPATTIMKLTGHRDLRTLLKYENTSVDAAAEALESVGPLGQQVILMKAV